MIKKQIVKSRKVCKVTFELTEDVLGAGLEVSSVELVSNFNNWEPVAFGQLKTGKWKLIQEFSQDASYEFRYRVVGNQGEYWLNDESADSFVTNTHGEQNSVINC